MMMDMLKKEVNAEIQEKMLDANQRKIILSQKILNIFVTYLALTFNQMGINTTGPQTNSNFVT